MYLSSKKQNINKFQDSTTAKRGIRFADNRSVAAMQGQSGKNAINPNQESALIQGYFTDRRNSTLFGEQPANSETLSKVRAYLTIYEPDKLEEFDQINSDKTPQGKVSLQTWLTSIGTTMDAVEFASIQAQFPQTSSIPFSWVASIKAHNPGGPPLSLSPPELQSPTSSQGEEMGIEEETLLPTDLVTDLSASEFTYHRTNTTYPITPEIRSDMRASSALTNSYIDWSPSPLIGKNTAPIKKQTDEARTKERKRDPARSQGKTLSHHPDTFWTGKPQSEMGWHPVNKHTNTLEGDSHDLPSRTGTKLTGMITKEKRGFMRPTLEALTAHQKRVDTAETMMAESGADLTSLRERLNSAQDLVTTSKAIARWSALDNVIERLEIAVDEEGPSGLGALADYYLEMTFDRLPESTSAVDNLLVDIAEKLRELP